MKKICLSIFLDANGFDYECLDKIRPTSYTLKNNIFLLSNLSPMPLLHQAGVQIAQQSPSKLLLLG
tara:strand:+ start:375 stop:572 length:198 start_codon:yes stop_codon:yes gene_type:complete